MSVGDRTTLGRRETDGVLPGLLPMRLVHGRCTYTLILWVYPTLRVFPALDSGIKYCHASKLLPGVLLPSAHLHSKPGLSNVINSFVPKGIPGTAFARCFLPWAKPTRAW